MRYFNFLVTFDNGKQLMEFGVKKESFPSRKYLGETIQQQHPNIDLSDGFSVTRMFEFNNEEDFNSYNQLIKMQKVIIELEFFIGQMVYLKTDTEQRKRIVTGINIRPLNAITYTLALGDGDEMAHYGIEISSEPDVVMSTFN